MNESLPLVGAPPARVTYCGNVHAAETLDAWLTTLPRFAARVAAGRAPFDLGVWWPAPVAAELARSAPAQRRVAAALAEHGLRIATVNAFPYRGFHDASVKTAVYRPDWASAARVTFSLDVAHAAAALAPAGSEIAISTLPLGFGGGHIGDMRENLARVAREYAALAASSGVRCVLAIEPEPHCLVETASEALACIAAIRDEFGGGAGADPDLRDHLGLCVDLCHLAVVGEDPLAVLAQARRAQVPVPKIQVSSCLEVRGPDGLAQLLAWDEPRYLHQTVGELDSGVRLRALDLGEVRRRREEFARCRALRTHFHVPLFWDQPGPLGSTRAAVIRALRALPDPLPLLEVETYTWSVLPGFAGGDDALVAGIGRELAFVHEHLARRGPAA